MGELLNLESDSSGSIQFIEKIKLILICFASILFFNFQIVLAQNASISLITPSSGNNILAGTETIISWTSFNLEKINIEYSLDAGKTWIIIKKDFPAKPSNLKWKIPKIKKSDIIIRIGSINNSITSEVKCKLLVENISPSNNSATIDNDIAENNNIIKIMPLGDSITEGLLVSENQVGYRRPLDSLLSNIGFSFDLVGSNKTGLVFDFDRDNEGHGGWHAKHKNLSRRSLVDSLYKWLENADPDVILLHIGTNDIGELDIFNETTEDVISDVEELLDLIDLYEFNYDRSIFVFLAQIVKRIDDPSTPLLNEEDSTIVFNDKLQPLVENRILDGDNIALVNQENKISYPDDLPDGVHPNDVGYGKMASAWFDAIMNHYNYSPIILSQPSNCGAIVGNPVKFSISVSGLAPISLQWYKNEQMLIGKNDSTLIIDSTSIFDDGSKYYCSVSNPIDTIFSDTVELFVTPLNEKVDGGILTYYDFEEGSGDIIIDSVSSFSQANLVINSPSTTEWIDHGMIVNSPTSITSDSSAVKIYERCVVTNEITVEAWIKPGLLSQTGPARIVTFSGDGSNRNFTLGQDGDRYSFRLRTTETNNNGLPDVFSTNNSADTNLINIVFTRNCNGSAIIYINGKKNNQIYLPGNFSNWETDYLLGIGNEFTDARPWLGELYQLTIYNRSLDSTEVLHNFKLGEPGITELNNPLSLEISNNVINKITLNWVDDSEKEDGFIIERADVNNQIFTAIDSTAENEVSVIDTSILEGIPYYYRVKSFNIFTKSEPSDTAFIISESNIIFSPTELEASTDTTGNVFLNWVDNSQNNYGFIIERRPDLPDSNFYVIDSTLQSSFVDTIPKSYSVFEYRIKAYNFSKESNYSNVFKLSGITDVNHLIDEPMNFSLAQNYPNPFNPATTISFSVPQKSEVNLEVFNSLGERVAILIDSKIYNNGNYYINLKADNYPSGVYFYKISAIGLNDKNNFSQVKKMLLLK